RIVLMQSSSMRVSDGAGTTCITLIFGLLTNSFRRLRGTKLRTRDGCFRHRIIPAIRGHDSLVNLRGSPHARLIFIHRSVRLYDWIDDSPSFFDVVFASEQRGVAGHRISKDALVSVHFVRIRTLHRHELHRLTGHLRVRRLDHHSVRDRKVRTDPESKMIRLYTACSENCGWPSQPDEKFRTCHGQTLPGPDVKGNALPTPGVDLELQGRKRLDFRIRRHALLGSIAAKLAANDIVLTERRDRFQNLDLLVPDGLAICSHGRLHR